MTTMTKTHRTIATDSELALHDLIGDDSTATLENDPKFVEANPGAKGSSENVEEQRDTDDTADSEDEEIDADLADAEEDDEDEEDEEDDEEADEEADDDEVAADAALNRQA